MQSDMITRKLSASTSDLHSCRRPDYPKIYISFSSNISVGARCRHAVCSQVDASSLSNDNNKKNPTNNYENQ